MNYTIIYAPLFMSVVLLCSVYTLFIVLYVNDKSQKILGNNTDSLQKGKDEDAGKINDEFKTLRTGLIRQSKKIMLYLLVLDIVVNVIIIIARSYYTVVGIAGGLILPFLGYSVFVFFLMLTVGLKGQKVSLIGRLFKGLDL